MLVSISPNTNHLKLIEFSTVLSHIFRTLNLYKELNSRCRTKTNVTGKYGEISYDGYLKLYPYQKHSSTYTVFEFKYLKMAQQNDSTMCQKKSGIQKGLFKSILHQNIVVSPRRADRCQKDSNLGYLWNVPNNGHPNLLQLTSGNVINKGSSSWITVASSTFILMTSFPSCDVTHVSLHESSSTLRKSVNICKTIMPKNHHWKVSLHQIWYTLWQPLLTASNWYSFLYKFLSLQLSTYEENIVKIHRAIQSPMAKL